MTTTALLRPLDWLIDNTRFPVIYVGLSVFLPLMLLALVSGSIYPAGVPFYKSNPLEITGGILMTAVLPSYLLMCFVASLRAQRSTHAAIASMVQDPVQAQKLRHSGLAWWPLGIVFGLINARINVNPLFLNPEVTGEAFRVSVAIAISQLAMWLVVGQVLYFAVHEGMVLHRLSKLVEINVYKLDSLNGFGEAALSSFLMVAGALSITMLQSLDLEFRWYNYQNGLLVGIPALLILVPLPIWNLHLRIRDAKQEVMQAIDGEIDKASESLQSGKIEHLNQLLMRREQIAGSRNWPMNISIANRFLLYTFIVPAAWAGAALMEVVLDTILGL